MCNACLSLTLSSKVETWTDSPITDQNYNKQCQKDKE